MRLSVASWQGLSFVLAFAAVDGFRPLTAPGLVLRQPRSVCSRRLSPVALPSTAASSMADMTALEVEAPEIGDGEGVPPENLQKARTIRDAIRSEDKRLRGRFPLLQEKYQDVVGSGIFLGAIASWALFSLGWFKGVLGGWQTVALNAMAISLLHEMEHDLIHDLYFKRLPRVQDLMFAFIWALKGSASPWWRKKLHLKHHQESGQVTDAEERLIGLGLRWWSPRRALITLTPFGTLAVAHDIHRDEPNFSIVEMVATNIAMVAVSAVSLIIHGLSHFGLLAALAPRFPWLVGLATKLVPWTIPFNFMITFPNLLRQASLVTVSTWSHYFGDIPKKDLMFQTQILNHWLLAPLQLFCFNFGETHILHHFYTSQPFYLRQLSAGRSLPVLKAQGCRHNDLGNMLRANRWGPFKGKRPSLA